MTATLTISRKELVRIIDEATPEHWADSTKARVRKVAATTEAVAVGDSTVDGVGCPMQQIGRRSAAFQNAYDLAMWRRFGEPRWFAFAVTVEPERESA